MRMPPRLLCGMMILGVLSHVVGAVADDDVSLTVRYFDKLRQRGLFSLAEARKI